MSFINLSSGSSLLEEHIVENAALDSQRQWLLLALTFIQWPIKGQWKVRSQQFMLLLNYLNSSFIFLTETLPSLLTKDLKIKMKRKYSFIEFWHLNDLFLALAD